MFSRSIIAVGALLALAGCGAPNSTIGSPDPGFGEAVAYDVAVQTINPDPVYPADGAKPGDSGVKAADASKRYRTGAVKQPEVMSSTSGSSGSGGGSR
ncbi:MAG: hypothetical protein ABIQ32_07930 [Sphingomicrobium sp.]